LYGRENHESQYESENVVLGEGRGEKFWGVDALKVPMGFLSWLSRNRRN